MPHIRRDQLLHLPVDGSPIAFVPYVVSEEFNDLGRLFREIADRPEKVRIGIPYSDPPMQFETNDGYVCMLVASGGAINGQPVNATATTLYRAGARHEGTIHGDAYLAVYPEPPYDERGYTGLVGDWADLDFWTAVLTATVEYPAPGSPRIWEAEKTEPKREGR